MTTMHTKAKEETRLKNPNSQDKNEKQYPSIGLINKNSPVHNLISPSARPLSYTTKSTVSS